MIAGAVPSVHALAGGGAVSDRETTRLLPTRFKQLDLTLLEVTKDGAKWRSSVSIGPQVVLRDDLESETAAQAWAVRTASQMLMADFRELMLLDLISAGSVVLPSFYRCDAANFEAQIAGEIDKKLEEISSLPDVTDEIREEERGKLIAARNSLSEFYDLVRLHGRVCGLEERRKSPSRRFTRKSHAKGGSDE